MSTTEHGTAWEDGLAAVRAYAGENGHARVPKRFVSPDGHRTGEWVSNRRKDYAGRSLGDDRVAELESIPGWVWSPLNEQWSAGIAAVRAYATENANARVPREYTSPDGHRTGRWVTKRRNDFVDGQLDAERIAELESLPGWAWNMLDEQWSLGLAAVRAYAGENGHARVPSNYVSPDGHSTGQWVSGRRRDYADGKLGGERISELELLPGWVWNQVDQLWDIGVAAVRGYATDNGHARVPARYVSPDGHRTGAWVGSRRWEFSVGTLSGARITELESLPGWVWSAPDAQWLTGLAAVRAYVAENGHARVPYSYVSPDGHRTGQWVTTRRRDYADGKLSADQIAELEAIPVWSWNSRVDNWLIGLAAVRAYAAENGHARVPRRYVSPDGHSTGIWAQYRRKNYAAGSISPGRIAELESIPGWVWSARDDQWLTGLAAVRCYAAANGHANVPTRYVSPRGHKTGSWVYSRRRDYIAGRLTPDRIAELESIPGWVWCAS